MSGGVLPEFRSRRNRVYLTDGTEGPVVKKMFALPGAAEKEAAVYRLLAGTGLRTATLLAQEEHCLWFSFLDGEDYVHLLERQESEGLSFAPWDALADWLLAFHRATGLVQRDCNLRNFLRLNNGTAGLDFEDCGPGDPAEMLARCGAFILLYEPARTALKERIAARFRARAVGEGLCAGSSFDVLLAREEQALLERRQRRRL